MKKIVILGCENSHANIFLSFIKDKEEFKNMEVVGVYSHDMQAAQRLNEQFGVPIMLTYDEAVGRVDGVVVTARHGDNHYKYAKPYIREGVAMFIDKPITISKKEALAFMKECKEAGVKLVGGSSCKHADAVYELKADAATETDGKTIGGYVRCPVSLRNENGGFFFYAQHLVEVVCAIFGTYPKSVKAFENNGQVTVVFRYERYDVIGLFVNEIYSCYYAARVSEKHVKGIEFNMAPPLPYYREFKEFNGILSDDIQPISYKDFIAPVYVLNAIYDSMNSDKEVKLEEYDV